MHKIIIIGCPGSGKSTLARALLPQQVADDIQLLTKPMIYKANAVDF